MKPLPILNVLKVNGLGNWYTYILEIIGCFDLSSTSSVLDSKSSNLITFDSGGIAVGV